MKLFQAVLMAFVAAFIFTASVQAGETPGKFEGVSGRVDYSAGNRGNTYQEVTYEGNRKITTTYRAVGTRKVGLVGRDPYPVARSGKLADGGAYYTEDGVKFFRDTKKLDVEYQGQFNN